MSTSLTNRRDEPCTLMGRIGGLMLSVTALLGALCIVATVGAVAFDVKPLVFRSGSMAPAIETGALAIARTTDARAVEVGDVVSVIGSDGNRVTHRIESTTPENDGAMLVLRGDANRSADAEPYRVETVERVLVDVPRLGHAVAWASGPGGVFVGALVAGSALMFIIWSSQGRPRGGARRATAVVVVLTVGAGLTTGVRTQSTLAAFTDTATVASSSVSSYIVPKPVGRSCSVTGSLLGQKTATIVWDKASAPAALTYTAIVAGTGTPLAVTDNGSTLQTQFRASLLSTVLNQTYNVRITAVLPTASGGWTSAPLNQPVAVSTLGVGMICGTAS